MLTFKRFILEYFLTEAVIDDLKKKAAGIPITDYAQVPSENHYGNKLRSSAHNDSEMYRHVATQYHPMFDKISLNTIHNQLYSPTQKHYYEKNNYKLPTDHIIDKLAEGDPAKDKKHLPQIAHWYSQGDFRAEDLGSKEDHEEHKNPHTVYGVLSHFSDIKNKDKFPNFPHPTQPGTMLKGTSLKSYSHMTFPAFRNHVHKALGLDKAAAGNIEDHPDIEKLDEHEGTKLYHLKSEDAAKHAAKCARASWCTGWEGNRNMFDHYNRDGKIYLLHGKDGEFHQIHKESHQIMDRNDEAISPEELKTHYPEISKFKHINNYITEDHDMPFADDKTKHKMVQTGLDNIKNGKTAKLSTSVQHNDSLIMAKHGDHEQLKTLSDHIEKKLSRGNAISHYHRPGYAVSQARRMIEFGENLHPYNGPKGTAEHLGHLFTVHNSMKNIVNSLPLKETNLSDEVFKKHKEVSAEFSKHFPNQERHSLESALQYGVMKHNKPFDTTPAYNLKIAHAFLNNHKR